MWINRSAPTAAASVRHFAARAGPQVIATTSPKPDSFNWIAFSRAYSSYGLIVHFVMEDSSTMPPLMLTLEVVSGTCFRSTATPIMMPN